MLSTFSLKSGALRKSALFGLLITSTAIVSACSGGDQAATSTKANAAQSDTAKADGPAASNSALDADRAREGALGDMVLGNPEAAVTLVEYASFTCGHCASFHKSVFPDLKTKYVDTGLVKFVFRELPTPPHELSYIGSVLARCASDKGGDKAFFAVGDGLFQNQLNWVYGEDPKLELLKITNQIGMDEAAVDSCLRRQEIVDVINANVEEANETFKITGTPSFVLDGEKLTLKTLSDLDTALSDAVTAAGGTVPDSPLEGDDAGEKSGE